MKIIDFFWILLSKIAIPLLYVFSFKSDRAKPIIQKIKFIGLEAILKVKYPALSIGKEIRIYLPQFNTDIKMRKYSVDLDVFKYTFFDLYHKPIPEVVLKDDPVIIDLGANIGLSVLTFKKWYPKSKILAFEMDEDNFNLALYNTRKLNSTQIYMEAVSNKITPVSYVKNGREDGYSIQDNLSTFNVINVKSTSISDIIEKNNLSIVDYIKMDIEGAELGILKNNDLDWLRSVKNINIEFHIKGNDVTEYISILEKQGFDVYKDKNHWSSLTAINRLLR